MSAHRPRTRRDDLIEQSIGAELVIHDCRLNHIHSLNPTAAAVWHAADGARDGASIAVHLRLPLEIVELALHELGELDLLLEPPASTPLSRRQVMAKLAATGLAATTLPVIGSITGADATAAASCTICTIGSPCFDSCECYGYCDSRCYMFDACACLGSCHPSCSDYDYCTCSPNAECDEACNPDSVCIPACNPNAACDPSCDPDALCDPACNSGARCDPDCNANASCDSTCPGYNSCNPECSTYDACRCDGFC